MIVLTDPKDPDDIDDFTLDWSAVLAEGETITACALNVDAGDCEIEGDATIDDSLTTARVSGGTALSAADVRYRVTTSSGRQLDETLRIPIRVR